MHDDPAPGPYCSGRNPHGPANSTTPRHKITSIRVAPCGRTRLNESGLHTAGPPERFDPYLTIATRADHPHRQLSNDTAAPSAPVRMRRSDNSTAALDVNREPAQTSKGISRHPGSRTFRLGQVDLAIWWRHSCMRGAPHLLWMATWRHVLNRTGPPAYRVENLRRFLGVEMMGDGADRLVSFILPSVRAPHGSTQSAAANSSISSRHGGCDRRC